MKLKIGSWVFGCGLAFAAIALAPGVASAAACTVVLASTNPDGTVSDATDCDLATPASASPANTGTALNADNPGGLGLTWTFIDREPAGENEAGEIDAAFAITGTPGGTGTWLINRDAMSTTLNAYVVTMKDGAPLNGDFLWFLIDTSTGSNGCSAAQALAGWDLCGTWTMYGDTAGSPTPKNVSHMDLFAANNPGGTTTSLPEPGSVALLALVLGGIGFASRKRR